MLFQAFGGWVTILRRNSEELKPTAYTASVRFVLVGRIRQVLSSDLNIAAVTFKFYMVMIIAMSEYREIEKMAVSKEKKGLQHITLDELCGVLFGGKECLLQEWVDASVEHRAEHRRGQGRSPGGKAFSQRKQIEIFIPETVRQEVWCDERESDFWKAVCEMDESKIPNASRDSRGAVVRALVGNPHAEKARNYLAIHLSDTGGVYYDCMLENCRQLLSAEYDCQKLAEHFTEMIENDREVFFEDCDEDSAEYRQRDELYTELTDLASACDTEAQARLLVWLIIFAVLTKNWMRYILKIHTNMKKRTDAETADRNGAEARPGQGASRGAAGRREDENSPSAYVHRNEVVATYPTRSAALREELIDLIRESSVIRAVGVAISDITYYINLEELEEFLTEGKKFQLLFSDPEGKGREEREKEETGQADGHIARSVQKAVKNMNALKKLMIVDEKEQFYDNLKIMFYQDTPRVNMIFLDDRYVLIQFYADYSTGERTPSFLVENRKGSGVYEFYDRLYQEILERAEKLPVNQQ